MILCLMMLTHREVRYTGGDILSTFTGAECNIYLYLGAVCNTLVLGVNGWIFTYKYQWRVTLRNIIILH